MNLSDDKRRFQRGDSGAGGSLGTAANAGPAHPMTASIVRLECEADELRATNAVAEQERAILVCEMGRLREQLAEARGWAEAAWAKSDRAEKMLRIAAAKVDAQAERIRQLEGATNHAGGTPLSQWRECAEELVAACTLHYGGDDGEGHERSAEPFLRVMRAVERIHKLSKEATK